MKLNLVVFLFLIFGCTSIQQKPIDYQVIDTDFSFKFVSPLLELEKLRFQVDESDSKLSKKIDFKSKKWKEYVSYKQELDILNETQVRFETELEKNGRLILEKGRSYSFKLESFCLDQGKSAPGDKDSLTPMSVPKEMQTWLPEFLQKYAESDLTQNEAQTLIWALLSDLKFDELSKENQKNLKKLFPDAVLRFGNRMVESFLKETVMGLLPEDVSARLSELKMWREKVIVLQDDFESLKKVMVPTQGKESKKSDKWYKSSEGYFIKMTAFGYSEVQVDLYVPEEVRSPQRVEYTVFFLETSVGKPSKGQRLGISPKSKKRSAPKSHCEDLKKFKPKDCRELTDEDREEILKLADPKNFPTSRYASPPSGSASIEEETDCSHFAQEIYRRAGFEFPYSSTSDIECVPTFEKTDVKDAKPGDLVLYKSHIGILDKDGNIISATRGGNSNRSKRMPDEDGFLPSIKIEKQNAFQNMKGALIWRCP